MKGKSSHILTLLFLFAAASMTGACAGFDFEQIDRLAPPKRGPAVGREAGADSSALGRGPSNQRVSSRRDAAGSAPGTAREAERRDARGTGTGSAVAVDAEPGPSRNMLDGDEPPLDEALPSLASPALRPRPGQEGNRVIDDIIVAQRSEAGAGFDDLRARRKAVVRVPLQDVFFRFDSPIIEDDGKEALKRNAETAKAAPVVRLVIEGHCDERGSQSYNLVLGDRRARALERYLADLGIEPSKIETVSYGKERPFCTERHEACYQQNRRGHMWMEQELPDQLSQLAP